MTRVKICGLSTEDALDAALDAGADLVGFVVFPPSPRHLALERAGALVARASGRARTVVLTVDADDALLAAVSDIVAPDLLQLHGRESPERAAAVAARTGRPIIKALGIGNGDDLEAAHAYVGVAEMLLLDAKPPAAATRPGGNGLSFDWSMLEHVALPLPWLLAGGLTPETVAAALEVTGAPGVDVSSGVERSTGHKDVGLVRDFLAAARSVGRVGSPDRSV